MVRQLGCGFELAHQIGWHNLYQWARHLGEDTATWRALHPKEAEWSSVLHRTAMLADLIDATVHVARTVAQAHSKSRLPQPKPYPRPGMDEETERIGSDPIPVTEFDAWWAAQE